VDHDAQNGEAGNLVAEESAGSVTLRIYFAPTRVKIPKPEEEPGAPGGPSDFEYRAYDSFIIPYYEGSIRKTPRRSTLENAKEFAKDTAKRLNKDGAKAEFLSEKDRRIYILARVCAKTQGLDVDELCRKHVELQNRLKRGTLEQAVDFTNDHGERAARRSIVSRNCRWLPVNRSRVAPDYISTRRERACGSEPR
jgi:hypothetical protein